MFKYGHMIKEGDRFTYYETISKTYVPVRVMDLWPSKRYADRGDNVEAPRWAELWSADPDAIDRMVAIALIDSHTLIDGVVTESGSTRQYREWISS